MTKSSLLSAVLAVSLSLSGCFHTTDDAITDARDDLTDIELAKDLTRSFNKVALAVEGMEQPMIDAANQFSVDVEGVDGVGGVDENAVEASLISLGFSLALATSLLESAITEDPTTGEVIDIDYNQIAASTTFTSLLAAECEGECDESFTLTSDGSVTFASDTLSVTDVVFTTELFEVSYSVDPNTFEMTAIRGISLGSYDSTVSFNIKLPAETLGGNNTLALAISGLKVVSNHPDTVFELVMAVDASAQFGNATSGMTLNDLFASEDFNPTSAQIQIESVLLKLGAATFDGALSFALPSISDTAFKAEMSISGTLTNSLGEHVLASLSLGLDGTQSDVVDTYSLDGNLVMDLQLTFHSQSQGDLSVTLTGVGTVESAESYTASTASNTDYADSYTDVLKLSGDITITAAGESIRLNYIADETGSGSEASTGGVFSYQESGANQIKISDATYTSRDVYILLGSQYSEGSSEIDSDSQSGGVYVGNTKYGDLEFNEFTNTLNVIFNDGVTIELLSAN